MQLPEPLVSRTVRVRGRPMHYIVSTGPVEPEPAIVFVHGVGLSHRYMLPAAKWFATAFRTSIPDQPGFGLSHKPRRTLTIAELADALVDWMDAVGIERTCLLGNSVGCQVIVELAVRHPDRVRRAVLQGPTVDPAARGFLPQMWRWSRNRRAERSSDKGPIVVRDYAECGLRRLVRTFRHALEHRMEERLPRMECPTLVVRGSLDPIVPQPWAEQVTRLLPRGRLIVIPGCPHTANLEAPLELFRVVRPFFEQEREPASPTVRQGRGGHPVETAGPASR